MVLQSPVHESSLACHEPRASSTSTMRLHAERPAQSSKLPPVGPRHFQQWRALGSGFCLPRKRAPFLVLGNCIRNLELQKREKGPTGRPSYKLAQRATLKQTEFYGRLHPSQPLCLLPAVDPGTGSMFQSSPGLGFRVLGF